MTMITPSYLGETIEYSSLHACRSTLEDPTGRLHCQRAVRHGPAAISHGAGGPRPVPARLHADHLRDGRRPARVRRAGDVHARTFRRDASAWAEHDRPAHGRGHQRHVDEPDAWSRRRDDLRHHLDGDQEPMRYAALMALAVFAACSKATSDAPAPVASASPCQKDTDCKGDRICESGACVSPPPPSSATAAASQEPPTAATASAAVAATGPKCQECTFNGRCYPLASGQSKLPCCEPVRSVLGERDPAEVARCQAAWKQTQAFMAAHPCKTCLGAGAGGAKCLLLETMGNADMRPCCEQVPKGTPWCAH